MVCDVKNGKSEEPDHGSRAGFTHISINRCVYGFVANMTDSRVAVLFNQMGVSKGKTHFDINHLMPVSWQSLGRWHRVMQRW